jgi:two-component system LytT family response regulator
MRRRFRAVVVDDEPAGRAAVSTFLADVAAVEIVGEAGSGGQAIALLERTRPDLLFLDIQMPDRDGFAVLEALGDAVPRGVVLVTAHGEHAQRAFDVHAVDYVTKPFGRRRFMSAVERALRRLEAEEALDMSTTLRSLVRSLRLDAGSAPEVRTAAPPSRRSATAKAPGSSTASPGGTPTRIGVRLGNRTTLVDVDAIDWVEADGDLVRLHVGDRVHLLQSTMRDLEETLAGARFFRIHRSALVNLGRIDVLHREPDGGGSVAITTGVRLRVARSRWEALEAALGLEGAGAP